MKKRILLLSLAVLLLTLSLSSRLTYAQGLTKSDVETIKPQLMNSLSSLNTNISYIQTRVTTENTLFREYSTILGTVSARLNQTPTPSAEKLQNLSRTLTEMQRLASLSANWRADVKVRISNIIQILGNIKALLSSTESSTSSVITPSSPPSSSSLSY